MVDCDGCDAEFDGIEAWVEHVNHPDRLCWKAAEARVAEILTDVRGSRYNRSFAAWTLTNLMKSAYELGVIHGKEA